MRALPHNSQQPGTTSGCNNVVGCFPNLRCLCVCFRLSNLWRQKPLARDVMPKLKGKPKTRSDVHVLEKFLQTYEKHCTGSKSCVSPTIKQGLQKCLVNETVITKVTMI